MEEQQIVRKGAADALPVAGWQNTAKGKGRVQRRETATSSEAPNVLRITGVSAESAARGAEEGDPAPRYPESICEGWLSTFSMAVATESYKALACMRGSQAVLMRDAPLVTGLAARWSLQHVAEAMGTQYKEFKVLCSDAVRNRFIECDQAKNTFGSHYHVRECQTQALQMGFPEFAQCAESWTSRRLYFKDVVMRRFRSSSASSGASAGVEASTHLGARMKTELAGGIDWRWLDAMRRAQRHGPLASVHLEVGCINALLPASYECCDRLVAQVWGRQRMLLLDPGQAFNGLPPYPVHHGYDRYAMLDLEAPDRTLCPDFDNVRGRVVILRPGDVLFVPRFWSVHAQQLEGSNGSLLFRMQQGGRTRSREAIPLQISRLLEERVAAAEGVRNVRHWLSIIARGEEADWIDLNTVQGYRRIVFCESILDEVKLNLRTSGNDSDLLARRTLEAICQYRLMPTTWLNKDFREPLYLKDRPLHIPDTRSEEERKYPEFFRHKLKEEGWKVPDSVSTVPIPGYNM